jgi:hypothetical protein
MAKSMKLGGGGRFEALKNTLGKQGVSNPGALAAHIGRKKHGNKAMKAMSAAGRKRNKPPKT